MVEFWENQAKSGHSKFKARIGLHNRCKSKLNTHTTGKELIRIYPVHSGSMSCISYGGNLSLYPYAVGYYAIIVL